MTDTPREPGPTNEELAPDAARIAGEPPPAGTPMALREEPLARVEVAPGDAETVSAWPHRATASSARSSDLGAAPRTPREDVAYGPPRDDPRRSGEMPFLDHLGELRSVLVGSVIASLLGAVAGWWLAPRVLEDLIQRTVKHAIVLSPLEAFNERFKMSLLIGLMLVLPYVFYRVWNFVVPGLLKRERSMILPMALGSMLLFAVGIWAAYGYVVPVIVDVLGQFQTPSMRSEIRLGALLGFFYNVAIACGLVMQLPMVTMTLTALGIVTPGFLVRQWRWALVLVFLVTALITPGDVVTAQVIMGVPLTLLYFVSVGLSWLVARRRARGAEPSEGDAHA